MPTLRRMTRRGAAAGAALGAVAGLVALGGAASAADASATTAAGTALLVNGTFAKPGPATHEGAPPTGWKLVNLGAEKKPYSASIGVYNAKGEYPPPAGNPNKSDIAVNEFYESGTATGVEGIAGQQSTFAVKSITQANNPQVSFANAEVTGPPTTNADWAGSGLEIVFTSGTKSYTLVYLDPWTAPSGTYSGKPADTAATKYILGATLKPKVWHTQKATSLSTAIKDQFKLTTYTVKYVRFINLEDTTSAASPYANMNGYVADVSLAEGSAS